MKGGEKERKGGREGGMEGGGGGVEGGMGGNWYCLVTVCDPSFQ